MLAHLSKVTKTRSDSVGSSTNDGGALKTKLQENRIQREKLRKIRIERAARALLLQSKQRLIILVNRRKGSFQYLKRVHGGGKVWMNCVTMSKADILKHSVNIVPAARTKSLYYFCLSLWSLLEQREQQSLSGGMQFVKSVVQLLDEFDYYYLGQAMQSVKLVMAKQSDNVKPCSQQIDGQERGLYIKTSTTTISSSVADDALKDKDKDPDPNIDEDVNEDEDLALDKRPPIKGTLFKFNGAVVYEYLQAPSIPFDLDYAMVVDRLSDSLIQMYVIILVFIELCHGYLSVPWLSCSVFSGTLGSPVFLLT